MTEMSFRALVLFLICCATAFGAPGIRGLDASGPAPDVAGKMMLFGQFAGDWDCEVDLRLPDGSMIHGKCEWHFGWALQGRAIQDVWIAHYDASKPGAPTEGYGTTIRWYDPKADLWHAIWISARDNTTHRFVARKTGDEIVLSSDDNPEHPYRWIFFEITPQSFRWRSEGSPDGGKTWMVGQEMRAKRQSSAARNQESDRRAIEQMEQEWLNAESDRPKLERILADDFVHAVSAGVFLTKQQHIDWSVQHPRPADRKARFEKLDVRLYGDAAIATGIVEDTGNTGGNIERTVFTDVFAYRTGRWQAVSAEETAVRR